MSAPITARVHAPTAPLWQRVIVYSIAWSFLLAGLVALNSFPIADWLLDIGAWLIAVAPFFMRRRNAKSAEIYVSPGQIVLRAPLSFPRTITTRSLRGAALDRAKGKSTLWLAEAYSLNTPITIEADERGVKEIRKALGIRRGGFGEIRNWPDRSEIEWIEIGWRAVSAVALTGWALATLFSWELHFSATSTSVFAVSLAMSAVLFMNRAPLVRLAQTSSNVLNEDEPPHIEQLQRGNASIADWLARVDAIAATQTEAGYRGAHFSQEDLWNAVENHETAPDIRAAAARLLMRISAEKSHGRVATVLESIHDDTERAHLCAALDSDLEVAAREIESLDEKMIARRQ